jgi:hypothetical protein
MRLPVVLRAAGAAVCAGALVGCQAQGDPGEGGAGGPGRAGGGHRTGDGRLAGCAPLSFRDVAGRPPAYLHGPLADFPNDRAACAAWWLPGTGTGFVPQGVAVRDGTVWVSGYDEGPPGGKYCRVMRLDLGSGSVTADHRRVTGNVGLRPTATCLHGGGLAMDEHGLWLTQRTRLWLLDPTTLEVRRVWALWAPVRGSFATTHDGLLGLGGYDPDRPSRLHWFDPGTLLAVGVLDITADLAVDAERVPARTQGATAGRLGAWPERTWRVRSTTLCAVLDGGPRRRVGILPGAEGAVVDGRHLWVVSETTASPYFGQGGRPVVPQLVRYDLRHVTAWARPSCTP